MDPLSYVLFTLLGACIFLTIVFLMAWFTLGKQKYTLIWSLAFLVSSVQWFSVLCRTHFDSQSFYWMFATFLSMASTTLGLWGHCIRVNRVFKVKQILFVATIIYLSVFYFTVAAPHIGLKMSLYLFYDAVILFLCGVVILRFREKPLAAELGASITYFIFSLCLTAAAMVALMQGQQVNPDYIQIYLAINFISVPIAYVGIAFFVVYMMASDLSVELERQAKTDPLTKCLNRRGFYQLATAKIEQFLQQKHHVCLVYWDIDNFKAINDKHGHSVGDHVLIEVTNRVMSNIKSEDLIGRIGGEEFVILVGRTSYDDALNVSERLRDIIASTPIEYGQHSVTVTASFGVIALGSKDFAIENAIDMADKALYEAKAKGRNQVVYCQN